MAFEKRPKTGAGSLQKNESDNPNAPVLRGYIKVDSPGEHWISVFRPGKYPGKYGVSLEKKEPRPEQDYQRPQQPRYDDPF